MTDDQPKPIPRKSPGDKKRSGPSMREQIAARRKAESEGQAPAAAKPAGSKPARAKAPAAKATAAKAPAEKGKRPASRSGAARAGGRARAKGGDGDGEGSTRTRRARPEKKKSSPMPLIAAGVLIVGGGIGAYASGMFSGKTEAAETPADDTDTAKGPDGGGVDGGDAAASDDTTGGADETGETSAAEGAGATDGEGDMAAGDDAPAKTVKPAPSDVTTEELYAQLRALEPFGKPDELSDEEWTVFVEKAALAFEDGGGPSSRAERWLGENGKYAWPALLNEIIKVDPANPAMNPVAERATLVMNTVRGSTSRYGFDYQTASKSKNGEMRDYEVRKNIRIILALHESWSKVIDDPEHWEKIDVSEQAQEAVDAAKKKLKDELSSEDEFGDVDVPIID